MLPYRTAAHRTAINMPTGKQQQFKSPLRLDLLRLQQKLWGEKLLDFLFYSSQKKKRYPSFITANSAQSMPKFFNGFNNLIALINFKW